MTVLRMWLVTGNGRINKVSFEGLGGQAVEVCQP
jgi:hypothetical protein